MSSSLAPILVNWFVASEQNYQLQINSKTKPLFYTRYADDKFVVTQNKTVLTNYCHEMNTLHPNLEFTLERSVDGKLSFLDTEVKQVSNQLHTNVYRKALDTDQIIQYPSICPKSWELGLINFYLIRALNICSNFTAFKEELTKIKN